MQGLIGCLSIIGYVACVIVTGIWSWNWIDPHSFWTAIKFMFVWGISSSIICGIWSLVCAVLAGLISKNE